MLTTAFATPVLTRFSLGQMAWRSLVRPHAHPHNLLADYCELVVTLPPVHLSTDAIFQGGGPQRSGV